MIGVHTSTNVNGFATPQSTDILQVFLVKLRENTFARFQVNIIRDAAK